MTNFTNQSNNNSPAFHSQTPQPEPQRIQPNKKESQELITSLRVKSFKESVDEKQRLLAENEELRVVNQRLSQLLADSQELIYSLQSK